MRSSLGLGPTNFTMSFEKVQLLLRKASLFLILREEVSYFTSRQHWTRLCYRESYLGRVLLLPGIILGCIDFSKKGLVRPRVFIRKVFSMVEFKFMRDTRVNLASANLRIC